MVVAPRTGAWIETTLKTRKIRTAKSHPVRVRGLKLIAVALARGAVVVAPRTGAWIETARQSKPGCPPLSHPVRVRGLKHK